MHPDEVAFQAALDADPADQVTRLAFADWLQDRDDPRAAGYAAMVALGVRPMQNGSFTLWNWRYFQNPPAYLRPYLRASVLPRDWYESLTGSPVPLGNWSSEYTSCSAAENAAALAFARLSPERQAELLSGVVAAD